MGIAKVLEKQKFMQQDGHMVPSTGTGITKNVLLG